MSALRRTSVLALLLLLVLPSVGAQDEVPLQAQSEDPPQDTRLSPADMVPSPAPELSGPDLRFVNLTERQQSLDVHVHVDAPDSTNPLAPWGQTYISLLIGERRYELHEPGIEPGDGSIALYAVEPESAPRLVSDLGSVTERSPTDLLVKIPRTLLLDENGAPGLANTEVRIEDVSVRSGSVRIFGATLQGYDRLDDATPLMGTLVLGEVQDGSILIHSSRPYRASNGEVGTFVYDLNLRNQAGADEVQLEAVDTPDGWNFFFPSGGRVPIEAGANASTFVVVTTPFQHRHGDSETFRVVASSTNDGTQSSVELGVHFLAIPQPAGHHDILYLHSRSFAGGLPVEELVYQGSERAFLSTLEEDPASENVPVRANANSRPLDRIAWTIPLDPSLAIGLQLDPEAQGTLDFTLRADLPLTDSTVHAEVLRVSHAEPLRVAHAEPRPLAALAAGESIHLSLPIMADTETIPYEDGSDLLLEVVLTTLRPTYLVASELPYLEPGGRLALPLLEYHDLLPVDAREALDISLDAPTVTQRKANPGDRVTFNATLLNHATSARTIRLDAEGSGRDHALLGVPSIMTLDAGKQHAVSLQVVVPKEMRQNDLLEVVLVATPEGSGGLASLVRFAVIVDERMDHPSDPPLTGQEAAKQDAPAPTASAILLVVMAALLASRRRT